MPSGGRNSERDEDRLAAMSTVGNAALRGARQAQGYRSQTALAEALNQKARDIGLRGGVTDRTVRRWESDEPGWPSPEHARALEALLGQPITELGFTPPWADTSGPALIAPKAAAGRVARHLGPSATALPASVASDVMAVTIAHRHLYWSSPAARLHRCVDDHATFGMDLLEQVPASAKQLLGRAVSESSLLAGRLAFFDLHQREQARASFVHAVQAAQIAQDSLLGAAAMAHMAFAPAFSGDPDRADEAREHLRAARAFTRRGNGSGEMVAWIDAVEAEVEACFGRTDQALRLIQHAEHAYAEHDPATNPSPAWLDWFSPARLAGFKGRTLLAAGQGREAREALTQALADLPPESLKQRTIYLADAAAASALESDPQRACDYLGEALELLGRSWYATGMERVREVRQSLVPWDSLPEVRDLDGKLYDWHTAVNSLMG